MKHASSVQDCCAFCDATPGCSLCELNCLSDHWQSIETEYQCRPSTLSLPHNLLAGKLYAHLEGILVL